jgi:hypothetical protein
MTTKRLLVRWFCLAATTASVFAQSSGDEQAIRQRFADLHTAWNHHDAQQITNPQTVRADADFITVV